MTRFILLFMLIIAMYSCKKSEQAGIMISIENNTSFTVDSVRLIYDTTNFNFGTILPGKSTPYIFLKYLPDAPSVRADSANKKIFAGRHIPPNSFPIPILANGKYTLVIFPDSTLFYLYGAEFIKN